MKFDKILFLAAFSQSDGQIGSKERHQFVCQKMPISCGSLSAHPIVARWILRRNGREDWATGRITREGRFAWPKRGREGAKCVPLIPFDGRGPNWRPPSLAAIHNNAPFLVLALGWPFPSAVHCPMLLHGQKVIVMQILDKIGY